MKKNKLVSLLLIMVLVVCMLPVAVMAAPEQSNDAVQSFETEQLNDTADELQLQGKTDSSPSVEEELQLQEDLVSIESVTIEISGLLFVGENAGELDAADYVGVPQFDGYSVDGAEYYEEDPLEDPFVETAIFTGDFEAGKTYYMLITLVPDTGYRFLQGGESGTGSAPTALTVNGADAVYDILNVINYADEDGFHQWGSALVSFTPVKPDTKTGYKDVYIDNTEDKSISIITGVVHITGNVGTEAGYDQEKTVYNNEASVTYSNPKTSTVQGMINDAYTKAYNIANDLKKSGSRGEFHMSTSESSGRVWDLRKYVTLDDTTVIDGPGIDTEVPVNVTRDPDAEYKDASGKEWDVYKDDEGNVYTADKFQIIRTHLASGEYGKETFYKVAANGWVSKDEVAVTGIKLDKTSANLGIDKSLTLKATISPEDATNKKVTWTSSNSKVASVDSNGKVTGISRGTATITATTVDGKKTATCKVTALFSDVMESSEYYYAPVYWAADKGITNGYMTEADKGTALYGQFGHAVTCSRAHVVTFLWRLAGKPNPKTTKNPFKDIKSNAYYYKAVLWAAEKGITKGYSDGTFKPDAPCLREHVVTFLWRYAGKPNPTVKKNPFNDIKSSDYYYKASVWANQHGVAKGYSTGDHKGGFGPKLDCLREHVVTFLYRYSKLPKSAFVTTKTSSKSSTTTNTTTKTTASAATKTTKTTSSAAKISSKSSIVYWTPSGKSYHSTKNCSTLKRSTTILSGTIAQSGKSDPCNVCYK